MSRRVILVASWLAFTLGIGLIGRGFILAPDVHDTSDEGAAQRQRATILERAGGTLAISACIAAYVAQRRSAIT